MPTGKTLMLIGLALFILGLLLDHSPKLFAWFGRLPGDIRSVDENRFIFFPVTSMILISLLLTLLFNLFFRK